MMHAYKDVSGHERVDADVVVVGTGAGGAVAAWRLRKAGKSVALIEEGSFIKPEQYTTDSWAAMRQLYRDNGMRAMVGTMIIPTMQARVVGGTTVVNSAICFRLPDDVLDGWVETEKLRGLTSAGLAPHFEEIERITNISPEPDEYLGMNNLLMRKACENIGWKGEPIARNSRGCKGCGVCMSGCVEGAKLSTDRSFVPLFLEAGGELYTDCRIEKIITENGRVVGVSGAMIEPRTLTDSTKTLEVRAKAVVISCGAMGTPVLLQKNDLANSSGMVGRNLCNHTATGMVGFFKERVCAWEGVNQGYCCDEFRKDGFIVEVAWAPPDVIGIRLPGFGIRHKDMMARLGDMALWGAMIRAKSTGRVMASSKGWSPTIIYNMNRRDARLMQIAMKATADLLFAGGAEYICPGINKVPSEIHDRRKTSLIMEANLKATDFSPIGNHPNGTCRMSEDQKRGVVNSYGETHDVKNLFIADASIFPNSPGVNPQVTIMALASHIADHISERV
ncbi:MAG TPA: GMC family oxidoreductase [bacterium]|nr:GMC family oxidoreductase [bacterium]